MTFKNHHTPTLALSMLIS